jgi:DNA-binding LacI/PurR family transcriptional regulator
VDISVACFGYGEHEWNSIAEGHDKISTVVKPRYELGQCAAEILLSQRQRKYAQTGVIKIPTPLLFGNTTGPAPGR